MLSALTVFIKYISWVVLCLRSFKAEKTENSPECGPPFIKSSTGVLRSPGYPIHYRESLHCVWIVHSDSPLDVLQFEFLDMELEQSEDCAYDYISFHALSPTHREQQLLGRFCGDTLPEKFTSPSSAVKVVFNSDITNIRRGFVVRWSQGKRLKICSSAASANRNSECTNENYVGSVCSHNCEVGFQLYGDIHSTCVNYGHNKARWSPELPKCMAAEYSNQCGNQVIENPSGTLRSPQSPVPYSIPIQCTWTIAVDSEFEVLDFEFLEMKIPESESCALAYVEFYSISPLNHQKTLNGRFCGNNWPDGFSSTSPKVKIVFNSQVDDTKGGFVVKWRRAKRSVGCTDTTVTNGNHQCTNGYQVGSVCTFNCDPTYNMLGEIESTCVTTEMGEARWSPPFPECTLQEKENDCGREALNSSSGSLISPIYHSKQSVHVYCTWYISAERNDQVLEFEFEAINIRKTPNCAYDYVEFHSLLETRDDEYLIGRFCGENLPPKFTSDTSRVKVSFSSFVNSRGGGFSAIWRPGTVSLTCPTIFMTTGLKSMCTILNQIGSECIHTCEGNLNLAGSSTTLCVKTKLDEARWSPETPSCAMDQMAQADETADESADAPGCPLPFIASGYNNCPEGTTLDSICRFSCIFGYEINGALISTCSQVDGVLKWTPDIPDCKMSTSALILIVAIAIGVLMLFLCLACSICCAADRSTKAEMLYERQLRMRRRKTEDQLEFVAGEKPSKSRRSSSLPQKSSHHSTLPEEGSKRSSLPKSVLGSSSTLPPSISQSFDRKSSQITMVSPQDGSKQSFLSPQRVSRQSFLLPQGVSQQSFVSPQGGAAGSERRRSILRRTSKQSGSQKNHSHHSVNENIV